MTQLILQQQIERLLTVVEKPSRYIGGETNETVKPDATVRVALSYPDAYEIGISNQALQILYGLINDRTEAAAERVYCPWPDMADAMRLQQVPLFTLETWRPVRDVDLFGITLQAELTYSNVLELIDLAGIPIRSEDRTDRDPIVLAGGPSASNPMPLAHFIDAFFMGEAEEGLSSIIEILDTVKGREERLDRLAELPFLYIPARGERPVERAVFANFSIDMAPTKPVVPYASAIFSRASVEVMRGCTRGCRFCHAGTWYRPVRERPVEDVVKAGLEQLNCTGYDELSLTSLATSDWSGVARAVTEIKAAKPELHLSLPSNRVDTGPVALAVAANSRQRSITLAPEAATQRMRDIICKTITDEMIEKAIKSAFAAGYTSLKLYFMIGLPMETFAEVQGIVDLGFKAREIGRRQFGEGGKFTVHVSASNFVPKPHTPFQWDGMAAPEQLRVKQEYLRRTLKGRQLKLSLHDVRTSMLEGAIGRGDAITGDVLEAAWRAGARFDAWTEHHREDAWQAAFTAAGRDLEVEATRERDPLDPLPWDHVRSGVTKEFLLDEWWQSRAERPTGDCRWDGCSDCGACVGPVRNRLVEA
ncbi:MAG: B12-binding domain-containing radical SAM protein [Thermoleophilia bacterium]|nr:MAG: B12-binding domain-containing radical SAM protein [Thermoleophilia bacterium]